MLVCAESPGVLPLACAVAFSLVRLVSTPVLKSYVPLTQCATEPDEVVGEQVWVA